MVNVNREQVRSFWNANPVAAAQNPHPLGSREYFAFFDRLRESIECPRFAERIHEFSLFQGKKVLDVGSGNGYVLSRYAQHGADVYGVDVTAAAVNLCRKRFAYMELTGSFQEADAESLPFADDFFDCVCSMGVLHHVPDTVRAVAEIHRVLKPYGRLILMMYHRDSALYRLKYPLLGLWTGKSVRQLLNEYDGAGNPKGAVYSKRELAGLLSRFQNLEFQVGFLEGHMLLPKLGRFVPRTIMRPLVGRWGFNLYANARKRAFAVSCRRLDPLRRSA
ncbi:MAG: methyltransferase domain-containing protein [Planctomycetes bacterium]|nr:methyltransferase domain-containing protein [Planctomycetota bacterium]